jgi:hypothetical protein
VGRDACLPAKRRNGIRHHLSFVEADMSSSIDITDELVAEIATRLADEGQKVSPVAIWSEVHTGSVVAVAASLRKWRETRTTARVPQVAERPALPAAVTDTMRDALDRLWTSAQDEAERAVARRLAAMRQRVDDACNERDDALAELQTTVQELDALQVQLDQITDAYEAKVDAAAGLEQDIALAVQRTDAAEKRAQEHMERVSTLETALEQAVAELAAEREARSGQQADAANESEVTGAAAESERAALEASHSEAVARLESELDAIRAALQAEQEAHAAQREEAAGAHAERDAATLELQNAQAQLASLADERTADASEIARLSGSLSEAQERASAAEQRAAELAESAESAIAGEKPEGADQASPAGVDPQAHEELKAQLSREAETHAAVVAEARENLKKWSDYANGLRQQLVQANENIMVALARSAGEASLGRRLAAELSTVSPEHEVLRKDFQQRLVVEAINAQLEQQGYYYDATTGVVSKRTTENSPA